MVRDLPYRNLERQQRHVVQRLPRADHHGRPQRDEPSHVQRCGAAAGRPRGALRRHAAARCVRRQRRTVEAGARLRRGRAGTDALGTVLNAAPRPWHWARLRSQDVGPTADHPSSARKGPKPKITLRLKPGHTGPNQHVPPALPKPQCALKARSRPTMGARPPACPAPRAITVEAGHCWPRRHPPARPAPPALRLLALAPPHAVSAAAPARAGPADLPRRPWGRGLALPWWPPVLLGRRVPCPSQPFALFHSAHSCHPCARPVQAGLLQFQRRLPRLPCGLLLKRHLKRGLRKHVLQLSYRWVSRLRA